MRQVDPMHSIWGVRLAHLCVRSSTFGQQKASLIQKAHRGIDLTQTPGADSFFHPMAF